MSLKRSLYLVVGLGLCSMGFAPVASAQVSLDIHVGRPGPRYEWVDGYWTDGPHRSWHRAHWEDPPYEHARWHEGRWYRQEEQFERRQEVRRNRNWNRHERQDERRGPGNKAKKNPGRDFGRNKR